MAEHSTFPGLHQCMEMIPFPGPSWHQVITEQPSPSHLSWSLAFFVACCFVQVICYTLTKLFASTLMGYTTEPAIPYKVPSKHKQHYLNLIEFASSRKGSKIYSMRMISDKYCDGQLSDKEISDFLGVCNQHRTEVEQNETRFTEALFPIFTKGFTLGFGILCFYDKDWVYDRALVWKGWPNDQGLDCCAADMKLLYMAHIGWYIYKLFAHAFIDRQLKDATANVIHHLTAMSLLCLSYYAYWIRIGIVVLLIHDPADVFLQSAKFFRLVHFKMMTDALFVCLVLVWFVTRLTILPFHVIRGCWYDFYDQHGPETNRPMEFCIAFLSTLFVLHIYWYYLILKVLHKVVTSGVAKDIRSDDDVNERR